MKTAPFLALFVRSAASRKPSKFDRAAVSKYVHAFITNCPRRAGDYYTRLNAVHTLDHASVHTSTI
ncbi:hypothetical protein PR003_g27517 [Phytophthora rubi]|uniref:Uncharacterized protein n=1 Tax=Phytophthora rubi TaxID=129364 RepID=A0A6A3P6S2_9STRA|nr:hypothetical protein PR001_g26401 [Phytophthora rubi]KAE9048202.1 hypothetical protein PR002_g574 [Phytophthora rubi]KAE9282016.1 hypothetical protein PR003_g27517 [Phytophthora rubi]